MPTTVASPSDSRFDHVATDPRFKSIPKRARKVRIDGRFQSMFTDDKFKVKYSVDKRGRKVNVTSSEDLRKYYDLDDGSQIPKPDGSQVPKPDGSQVPKKKQKGGRSNVSVIAHEGVVPISDGGEAPDLIGDDVKGEGVRGGDDSEEDEGVRGGSDDSEEDEGVRGGSDDSEEDEGVRGGGDDSEEDEGVRGGGDSDGDSSSTDIEMLGAEQLDADIVHAWGELEGDVPMSDDVGYRLAVCNMDWDRVSAQDLFVLFNSFKPQGGSIISVSIYPSDYGLERIAKEEMSGPLELTEETNEEEEFSKEKLRQYQLNRLKYYYAVMVCDSKDTAKHMYTNCDGMEYEHSANRFDLRYIPDDMSFDDRKPKSVATESTIPAMFTPSDFFSSALQQSKVQLTWDETDPQRIKTTMKQFTEDEALQQDFNAYLASSTDEEEDQEGGREEDAQDGAKVAVTEEEQIQKYRALLDGSKNKSGGGGGGGGDSDMEMEITWEPGLKETAECLVEKKLVEKEAGKLTAWQRHVQDKKKRKKELKEKRLEKANIEETQEVEAGGCGFSDPFFQQDNDIIPSKSQVSKKGKKSHGDLGDKQQKSELELLVQDEDPGKHHFSLKGILQQEKGGKKNKKRCRKDGGEAEPDTFQMNVNDPRFSALYDSHLYAVDPSDSHYKPTKGMGAVMEERLKRRRQKKGKMVAGQEEAAGVSTKLSDASIGSLVKAVKSKAITFQKLREQRKAKRAKITS